MTDLGFVRVGAAMSFVARTVSTSGLVTIALDVPSGALLECDDGKSITGIKITDGGGTDATGHAQYHETVVILRGKPGATATVVHESGSVATAAHRIRCSSGADMTLDADAFLVLVYRWAESRWVAYDLRGLAGEQGLPGAQGIQGPAGPGNVVAFSGTTSSTGGTGTLVIAFDPAFTNTPHVSEPAVIGGTVNQFATVTSLSSTGMTITAYTRSTVNLLGSDVLLGATVATNGVSVSVVVVSAD